MPTAIPTQREEGRMLYDLEKAAIQGKTVDLHMKSCREVVTMQVDGASQKIVALSMIYSGTVDETPFSFKKNYSFGADRTQQENALKCLLIANTRLQVDLDRLEKAGIVPERRYFTLKECFLGEIPDHSLGSPFLRIENFIHLSRAKVPVSAQVILSCPPSMIQSQGQDKRAHCCLARFTFATGGDTANVAKLYCYGCEEEDETTCRANTNEVANARLERDVRRLRDAGIIVDEARFK